MAQYRICCTFAVMPNQNATLFMSVYYNDFSAIKFSKARCYPHLNTFVFSHGRPGVFDRELDAEQLVVLKSLYLC